MSDASEGAVVLSAATCEVLATILVQQPVGQALLSAVRGEHGVPPDREMVLKMAAWLEPKAPVANRAERRRKR